MRETVLHSPTTEYAGTLARYPNEQFVLGFNYSDTEITSNYDSSTNTFYDKSQVVKTWKSVEGVQIKGNFEIDWSTSPDTNLVSYDASTNRVKIENVSVNGISGRYYYSNAVEEIDMVGEYYVDRRKMGILYFYAPENYCDIRISVPKTDVLISFDSADNITLDGIVIENCKGTLIDIKADNVTVQTVL